MCDGNLAAVLVLNSAADFAQDGSRSGGGGEERWLQPAVWHLGRRHHLHWARRAAAAHVWPAPHAVCLTFWPARALRGFCSYSMRLCSSTVPHLIFLIFFLYFFFWLLERPSIIYIIKPLPCCHREPINLCFCSTQGFVFDVKEQLPAPEAKRQKQMVSVLFSHYLVTLCTLGFRE